MALIEYYPQIKLAHLALVTASGVLFACRGAATLARQRWPMTAPLRLTSIVIDTLLLAAGVTLWALLSLQPLRDAWLGTKLALLVLYVMLGTVALKHTRRWAYAAALACYLFMISVALAHHPLGALRAVFG
jgi:uncharacterized membrane protein SirB2